MENVGGPLSGDKMHSVFNDVITNQIEHGDSRPHANQ